MPLRFVAAKNDCRPDLPGHPKTATLAPMNETLSYRQCLGKFATGVTVVTCADHLGRPCGITANSFSSVSLEPPLVLWNIAKVSNSLGAYLAARHFAVNVLTLSQRDLAIHFARSDHTLFDNVDYSLSEDGVALLPDTLACLECKTTALHDSGDHYIIVGEVERFRHVDGDPLLFFDGRYAGF